MSGRHQNRAWKKNLVRVTRWVLGTGFVGVVAATSYHFAVGEVELSFIRPQGRYFVLELINDTPADQVVKRFSVDFPDGQPIIGKTTRDVYGTQTPAGAVLPGGNTGWVPAAEFKELDGQPIAAGKHHVFRLPPLSSKDYIEMQAAVLDIEYEVSPSNTALAKLEDILKATGLRNTAVKGRYLMVDNHLIPTRSTSLNAALRIACRDDQSLSPHDLCRPGALDG